MTYLEIKEKNLRSAINQVLADTKTMIESYEQNTLTMEYVTTAMNSMANQLQDLWGQLDSITEMNMEDRK